jgi:hypothetical protein
MHGDIPQQPYTSLVRGRREASLSKGVARDVSGYAASRRSSPTLGSVFLQLGVERQHEAKKRVRPRVGVLVRISLERLARHSLEATAPPHACSRSEQKWRENTEHKQQCLITGL